MAEYYNEDEYYISDNEKDDEEDELTKYTTIEYKIDEIM